MKKTKDQNKRSNKHNKDKPRLTRLTPILMPWPPAWLCSPHGSQPDSVTAGDVKLKSSSVGAPTPSPPEPVVQLAPTCEVDGSVVPAHTGTEKKKREAPPTSVPAPVQEPNEDIPGSGVETTTGNNLNWE
jgi:hypothetical protein